MDDDASADFWENLYVSNSTPAQPQPNVRLIETVSNLRAGNALDLGCGNGGDAIWLARNGWNVTAVDISFTAVERLNNLAVALNLSERITAIRHDLQASFSLGTFDLINVHYLHTPFSLDRVQVLRTAAGALRADGRLLVVDHGSSAPWSWNQDPDTRFPHPNEIHSELDLDPTVLTAERIDVLQRLATGPDGQIAEVTDNVLLIRRAFR